MFYYKQHLYILLSLVLWPWQSQSSDEFGDCTASSIYCDGYSQNVSYPFRLRGAPARCGHPSFELQCTRNRSILEISMDGKAYRVINIRYDIQFVGISSMEYARDSCPQAFTNTTVDFSLFKYSDNIMNMTMFHDCPPPSASSARSAGNVIPCLANGTGNLRSYYSLATDDPPLAAAELYDKCSSVVLIPMFRDITDFFSKGRIDFLGVLQDGFGLNWIAGDGWCGKCVDSGGVCGNDPNSPNGPACICGEGRVANGTCTGR